MGARTVRALAPTILFEAAIKMLGERVRMGGDGWVVTTGTSVPAERGSRSVSVRTGNRRQATANERAT
jgi:hypothetical protein